MALQGDPFHFINCSSSLSAACAPVIDLIFSFNHPFYCSLLFWTLDTRKMSFNKNGKSLMSFGLWGGEEGSGWDDGVYLTVRKFVIMHGAGIQSIQFEYDKNGNSVWSERHGGSRSHKTDKVKLDYPDEFLTSVHGYYGRVTEWGTDYVLSLTLKSNRKTFGPYGTEQGTHFSLPLSWGKIVGFHGRSSWNLDAIGVHFQPLHKPNPSSALFQTPNSNANYNRREQVNYSVVQGNTHAAYDVVVAIRHKDECHSDDRFPLHSVNIPIHSSRDLAHTQSTEKTLTLPSVERMITKDDGPVTYGPFGGNGGFLFDDGFHTGIKQIYLSRNVGIASIRVLYDGNGKDIWGSKNGRSGGFKVDKITFDYPNEVLTYITGFFGPTMIMGPSIIKSLTFHTTSAKYGPYGEEHGTPFSTNVKEGKIIGFHGRKGLFIDAIGVHSIEGKVITPIRSPSISLSPSKAVIHAKEDSLSGHSNLLVAKQAQAQEPVHISRLIKEPPLCGPGPWGGVGGRPWDDGVFSGIRQIIMVKGEAICSIQVEYDRNGQSVWSVMHGGSGGATSRIQIKLDYPHEVLNRISGFYGPISKEGHPIVVKSLTFYTKRGKYGPFGKEVGSYFTSDTTEGKVVGFHGRSSMYLDAIGVHMQHWMDTQKPPKPCLRRFFS